MSALSNLSRLFGRTPDAPPQNPTVGNTSAPPAPLIPAGYSPITEVAAEDVFIVGYPKSGNTWFQNLAAAVVWGVIPEFAPPKLAQVELVPDVHARAFYRRYATPMFFKTHHLPRPEFRRVVYLLRDGRDAMVSYFHFLQDTGRGIDFLQMVRNGEGLFPCKWHEHVEAWLGNPYGAEIITIRYEDLKKDTLQELKRFCAFIGLQREDSYLSMMAQSAEFSRMRRREEKLGRSGVLEFAEGKFFNRRGVVGSYRDEMPADVLESFLQQSGPMLKKLGYS